MKINTENGVVIITTNEGVEIELHGENESLSITLPNLDKTYDISFGKKGMKVDGFEV